MSKGKRYSEDQIIKILGEIEEGASIASVARLNGITGLGVALGRRRVACKKPSRGKLLNNPFGL